MLIATNAPSAYDYSCTKEVGTCVWMRRTLRLVVVTGDDYTFDYQQNRYFSGVYSALRKSRELLEATDFVVTPEGVTILEEANITLPV